MFAVVSDKQEWAQTIGKALPASYKELKTPIEEKDYWIEKIK